MGIKDWFRDSGSDFEEESGGKMIELSAKIKEHKDSKRRVVIIIAASVAVLALLFTVLIRIQSYSDYKVTGSFEVTDSGSGDYLEFNGCLVHYSADGIAGIDRQGNELWQQTFEMQNPLVDVCGDSLAIAEKEGTQVYIFSSAGKKGEIATQYPVLDVSVSAQGITAVTMSDGNAARIICCSTDGEVLVESKASIGETGYPLDCAISEDGSRLLVSYLVPGETLTSRLVCYRFQEDGVASGDLAVYDESFPDLLIPSVSFMGEHAIAAGDGKLIFFDAGQDMNKNKELDFEETIVSLLKDSAHIALILRSEDGESAYHLKICNPGGNEIASVNLDSGFERAEFHSGKVILYSGQSCAIYDTKGKELFRGDFSEDVLHVYPLGGLNRYLVVLKDSVQTVRLVK